MSTIKGAGPARIAWGYRTAAALGAWTITIDRPAPGEFRRTLVAELLGATLDLRALRQPGLMFVVQRDNRPPLTWPVKSLQIGLTALTGELDAKEATDHGIVAVRSS